MERYKEELNNIHAPEALILRTLSKVHEEEKRIESETSEELADKTVDLTADNTVDKTVNKTADLTDSRNNIDTLTQENNVFSFRSYMDLEEPKKENESTPVRKKGFTEKTGRFIKIGSTLAAAALLFIIAMSVKNVGGNMSTSTPASDQAPAMYEESAEDSYDESYDEEYEEETVAESAAADASDTAEEAAYQEESSSAESSDDVSADSSAENTDTIASDESDSSVSEISDQLYYNELAEGEPEAVDKTFEMEIDSDSKKNLKPNTKNPVYSYRGDINGYKDYQIDQYSDYLGLDLNKIMEAFPETNNKIYVKLDDKDENIVDDIGVFNLFNDSDVAELYISKNRNPAPENLLAGTPSDILGVTVYAGVSSAGDKYFAAFKINNVNFLLKTNSMEKGTFEDILYELLN